MRTAQQIAREAMAAQAKETWSDDAAAYFNALSEIANLPEPVPFALPVRESTSIRVARVDEAEVSSKSVLLWIGDEGVHASPPYAAAWLRLFGLEQEAS